MIPKRIASFLDKKKIKYEVIEHRTVYTAFDKAKTLKVKETSIGKTVVSKIGKEAVLILISAGKNLDVVKFKSFYNSLRKKQEEKPIKEISFAKEAWIKKNLTGSKIGSVPPFGEIWGLKTFADRALLKNSKIVLNSGNHESSLIMTSAAYKKAVPDLILGSFSINKPKKVKSKKKKITKVNSKNSKIKIKINKNKKMAKTKTKAKPAKAKKRSCKKK